MLDAGDWEASYAATATSFRKANTLKLWSDTAEKVQSGLGKTLSRDYIGQDDVPSPPGIPIVPFRTDFTNRTGVVETISLVREDGAFLYTLPSVADDIDMGITHVVRGEDLADNTPRQIALQRALG